MAIYVELSKGNIQKSRKGHQNKNYIPILISYVFHKPTEHS